MKKIKIILLVSLLPLFISCQTLPKGNVNVYDSLHDAVLNSDTAAFNKVVSDTDSFVVERVINHLDSRGRTLLHIAVGNAQAGMTGLLLKNGANSNIKDSKGQTPLHIAVLNQAANIVSTLVANGADKTITDKTKKTPEEYAWELNNLAILNILNGGKGSNLANTKPRETEGTGSKPAAPPPPAAAPKTFIAPVSGAYTVSFGTSEIEFLKTVKEGDYSKAEKQLDFRQNPNTVDSMGNSVLFYAIDGENLSMVQMLINKGANVNLANKKKQSPLLYAVAKNNYAIVETLVAAGASTSQADADGITPIKLAVQNKNAPLVLYLIARGARVNDADREGNSILLIAAANNDVPTVKALIQNKADVYAANQSGVTPLDFLKSSPREELRQLAAGM